MVHVFRWQEGFCCFLLIIVLLAGCAPVTQEFLRMNSAGDRREPTSVVVAYRTLQSSLTPTPVISPTFTATPDNDPENYFGGLAITLDYVGQTVALRVRQGFLLRLGSDYAWNVEIHPPEIASRNMKITPEPGEQGIYIAREKGKAVVQAVGRPACLEAQPPCQRPDVLFQMVIIVE